MPVAHARCAEAFGYESFHISTNPAWDIRFSRRAENHTYAYLDLETEARHRLSGRDEDAWPYLALAIRMGRPIWTEDQDFFGSGVATWTTNRVEIYLASSE